MLILILGHLSQVVLFYRLVSVTNSRDPGYGKHMRLPVSPSVLRFRGKLRSSYSANLDLCRNGYRRHLGCRCRRDFAGKDSEEG